MLSRSAWRAARLKPEDDALRIGLEVWEGAPAVRATLGEQEARCEKVRTALRTGGHGICSVRSVVMPHVTIRLGVVGQAPWVPKNTSTLCVQLYVCDTRTGDPRHISPACVTATLLTLEADVCQALGTQVIEWLSTFDAANLATLRVQSGYVAWLRHADAKRGNAFAWADDSASTDIGVWTGLAPEYVLLDTTEPDSPWAMAVVSFSLRGHTTATDRCIKEGDPATGGAQRAAAAMFARAGAGAGAGEGDDEDGDEESESKGDDARPPKATTITEFSVRAGQRAAFTRKAQLGGWVSEALPTVLQKGGDTAPTIFFRGNRNLLCVDARTPRADPSGRRTLVVPLSASRAVGTRVAALFRDLLLLDTLLPSSPVLREHGLTRSTARLVSPWWLARAAHLLLGFGCEWDKALLGGGGRGMFEQMVSRDGSQVPVRRPIDSVRAFMLGTELLVYHCCRAALPTTVQWLDDVAIPSLVSAVATVVLFVTTVCRSGGEEFLATMPPVLGGLGVDTPRPCVESPAVQAAVTTRALMPFRATTHRAVEAAADAFRAWTIGPFEVVVGWHSLRSVALRAGYAHGTLRQTFVAYQATYSRWVHACIRGFRADLYGRLKRLTVGGAGDHRLDVKPWHIRNRVPPLDPGHRPMDSLHRPLMYELLVGRTRGTSVPFVLPLLPGAGRRPLGRTSAHAASVPPWLAEQLREVVGVADASDCAALAAVLASVDRAVVHALYTAPPCIVRLLCLEFMPTVRRGARHPKNAGRMTLKAFFKRKWNMAPSTWAPILEHSLRADGLTDSAVRSRLRSVEAKGVYSYSCDKLAARNLCPVASPKDIEDLGTFLHTSAPSGGCAWHNRPALTTADGRAGTVAVLRDSGCRKACSHVMLGHTQKGASTRYGQTAACLRDHVWKRKQVAQGGAPDVPLPGRFLGSGVDTDSSDSDA